MATEYTKCPPEVNDALVRIMGEHHSRLSELMLRCTVLFADAGFDEVGNPKPAVKHHGEPCAATVTATSAKLRAAGLADVSIEVDSHVWENLHSDSRCALLDHELEHIQVDTDKDGEPKRDCTGRPVLSMRRHDYHLSGFETIIRRYGAAAVETIELTSVMQSKIGQMWFKFGPVSAATEERGKDATAPPRAAAATGTKTATLSAQDLSTELEQATAIIRESGRATVTLLQRRLRIGYQKAARIMDLLEDAGVVGPPNGSEPRDINLPKKEAA